MNTRDSIKSVALQLFNTRGLLNCTLRDVAAELDKSYGNITYHFAGREELVHALYEDLMTELKEVGGQLDAGEQLLEKVLSAPQLTYDITVKYLFFYLDYLEIRRSFPALARRVDADNTQRMAGYKHMLQALQQQKLLRADLDEDTLAFLMELSGIARTFFFAKMKPAAKKDAATKQAYVQYVNRVLYPYLTPEGITRYKKFLRQ